MEQRQKKEYESVQMEIIALQTKDVIATSGAGDTEFPFGELGNDNV